MNPMKSPTRKQPLGEALVDISASLLAIAVLVSSVLGPRIVVEFGVHVMHAIMVSIGTLALLGVTALPLIQGRTKK